MLTPLETQALVDALRKSILYQTPTLSIDTTNGVPKFASVKIPIDHYNAMLELISKAGGWKPPVYERAVAASRHMRLVREALSTATDDTYDLRGWEFGDLLSAKEELNELTNVPDELRPFIEALAAEIVKRRQKVR